MNEEIKDTVGMDECVACIEEHFRDCQRERDMLYAEDSIFEEWYTLVEAFVTPKAFRTSYQNLIVEESEEVSI
jgi:hypothetical protein